MLVLKVCISEWLNASRDKRELSVYQELGADVVVLAKGKEGDKGRVDEVDGFKVYRYTTRPLGPHFPNAINRFVSLFSWSRFVRRLKPDVITGHDLMPALTIAWMSTWFRPKSKRPKLIYDSHEFELVRNSEGRRGAFATKLIAILEKHLMKRCVYSIMVNDSIADEVQKLHRLKERPVVVRNTPNYWDIDESICEQNHNKLLNDFEKAGGDVDFTIMYHGNVVPNRGAERLIEAVSKLDKVGLLILGNGKEEYLASLKQMAQDAGIEKKVLFHPAVPISELWKYVGAVDLGTAPIELVTMNQYYSLPNKFFECIQSLTPIITSDVPEMKRLIEKYQIGMTFKPSDADDICRCVREIKGNKELYLQYKNNLRKAKNELCWENEKTALAEIFKSRILSPDSVFH